MDKKIIRKNFSRYARYYDRYSTVQDLCASRLISKVKGNGFYRILDVGCGTGNYTRLLRKRFPQARIKALDISEEMISIARRKLKNEEIDFIVEDAERIDFKDRFDFISSNAAFQWFDNLEDTLARYRRLLNKNGIISFSIFGPLTLYELDASLRKLFGESFSIISSDFIDGENIKRMLKRLFKKVKVEEEIFKERHLSLAELLRKIRYTGTKGNGNNNGRLWTPKVMNDLERVYNKSFKDIVATYQVFYCRGEG